MQEYGATRNIGGGSKGNSMYKAPKRYDTMRPREVKPLAQGHKVHLQKKEEQSSVSCVPHF